MRFYLLVGEHHDYPQAKKFVITILPMLARSFPTILFWECMPLEIDKLKKDPKDGKNTFESIQELKRICGSHHVQIERLQSEEYSYLLTTRPKEQRCSDVAQVGDTHYCRQLEAADEHFEVIIAITGAGHLRGMARLLEAEHDNSVMVFAPSPKDKSQVMLGFCLGLLPEQLMLLSDSADLEETTLSGIFTSRIVTLSYSILQTMQSNPDNALPDGRRTLMRLYSKIIPFVDHAESVLGASKPLQETLASLEYNIGSLYEGEGNLSEAINYTQKSLQRKIANKTFGIEHTTQKLEGLQQRLLQQSQSLVARSWPSLWQNLARPTQVISALYSRCTIL